MPSLYLGFRQWPELEDRGHMGDQSGGCVGHIVARVGVSRAPLSGEAGGGATF